MNATVYFDLETGGIRDDQPDIQLAAIAVSDADWSELATFEMKIRFDESKADPEALRLNHYDPDVWKRDAKSAAEVVYRFCQFLDPYKCLQFVSKRTGAPYSVAKLAGHNAATFDGPRLKRLFGQTFLPADPRVRCTLQRAMWWFDERGKKCESFKLEELCKYFKIPVSETHDALADVRLTIELAKSLREATTEDLAA